MDHTSFARSDTTPPRHESLPADPYFSDFHLPLLDDRPSQKTPTTHLKHLSDESFNSDRGHPPERLSGQPRWTPFPLRRDVLLGFISVFASLLVALAVLYSYSQSHEGLSTADERFYYIWTYGPTAVLSVISAFWIQVVYRTKQLMPWKAMAVAPQPASKSILLDYISPIAPVALWRAIANSHLGVVLSILSTFIIIALTVASTGLFILAHVDITTHDAPLLTTNKFSFDNFDWASTDARPAGLVYATTRLGLQYPTGTTAQYAMQDFSTPDRSNATLTAVVDVFAAHLECEPATLQLTGVKPYAPMGPLFHSGATFNTTISTSDCTVAKFDITSATMLDSNTPFNGTQKLDWGYGQLGTCIEDSSERIVVSAGTYAVHIKWNGTENDYPIGLELPYNKMFQIVNSTNILCKPRQSIEAARVVKHAESHPVRPSQFQVVERVGHIGRAQDGGQARDVARAVFQSVSSTTTQNLFMNETAWSSDDFFSLLQSIGTSSGPDSAKQFWQQHDTLARESSAVYQSIAAQMAALKLLAPADRTIVGQTTENKPRLFVRALSFGLMEAGFVILIAISVYFFTSESKSVLSSDPASIHGLAVVLGKSSEVVRQLVGKECYQVNHLHAALKDNFYRTGPFGEIVSYRSTKGSADHKEQASKDGIRNSPSSMGFWQPSMLRMPTRIAIVLTTLIFVITLEILLTISQSRHGIVAIDTNSWLHYGWTYVPALLMVLLRITYDAANFSVKLINPYMKMSKDSVPADISIQDRPLSRTSLHELVVSAKRGQLAVFFTTIAALLASLLPIAVSGLYTAFTPDQDIKVHQLTAWDFDPLAYSNYSTVNETFISMNQSYPGTLNPDEVAVPLLTSLITSANLSYPSWTYAGLALPLINASVAGSRGPRGPESLTGLLNVTIPAVRGSLNCSVVSRDKVEVTYAPAKDYGGGTVAVAGNKNCINSTAVGSLQVTDPDMGCQIAQFSMRKGSSVLDGCYFEPVVIFLPSHGEDSQYFGYLSSVQLRNRTYCPTIIGMFGTTSKDSIEDYTWFGCSTEVDRVNAQTTFTLPDYTISSALADETTASHLDVEAFDAFIYKKGRESASVVNFTGPNAALNDMLNFDANNYLNFFNMTDGQNYDNFFSSLVYGRNGVPPGEMLGEAKAPRLFAAVQHLWRLILAQQFRTNTQWMTVSPHDLKAWAPNGPWNGTLVDPNAYRLQQSVVSTRILQGILAALALCGIVAFISCGSTSRLLPNNPSSIAVVASLLAGSEMLQITKKRQAGEEVQEEQSKDPWAGYLFSLGWWNRLDGGRRFGVDIGRANPVEWPLSNKPHQRFGLRFRSRKRET